MRKIVNLLSVPWRGSVTDLATNVAWLLTRENGQELVHELQRFLDAPGEAHKWAGRGYRDERPTNAERGLAMLAALPGVDAIFQSDCGRRYYVAEREHGMVDMDRVLEAEAAIQKDDPGAMVTVWAHQGRDLATSFPGKRLR